MNRFNRRTARSWLPTVTTLLTLFSTQTMGAMGVQPSVAFYYGSHPIPVEFRAFDHVVVEPGEHGGPPAPLAPDQTYAYVSLGELDPERAVGAALPKAWLLGQNHTWGSQVIDQSRPQWPAFFVEQIIGPLVARGYRNFFLDTLDSYQLFAKHPEARAAQEQGLIACIRLLKVRHPEARLIFNRGFEILPQIHGLARMVAVESLFQGWNNAAKKYVAIGEEERRWLLGQLKTVREQYRLPVAVLDYAPPGARTQARELARRIRALGFIPWVSNPALDMLGVGAIEVVPRRVLVFYDGRANTDFELAESPQLRFLAMPLEYMGYIPEYRDVNAELPPGPLTGRYAGVLSWFSSSTAGVPGRWHDWVVAHPLAEGVPVAFMQMFGFEPEDALLKPFGLSVSSGNEPRAPLRIVAQDRDMTGFETEATPDLQYFIPVAGAATHRTRLKLAEAGGQTAVPVATTPWGGYALAPFTVSQLQADVIIERWVLNPFTFLKAALRLAEIPAPDVTTENGRRLLMAHVDGDGFPSRAEMPGAPFAGAVLVKEVLERYRIPTTVSVIEAEVAPHGLYPQFSAEIEDIARQALRLPHVEMASHSWSHPFDWRSAAAKPDSPGTHLPIPGYRFDATREVDGSVAYIEKRLAPAGKRVAVFLWTGDCLPDGASLARTVAIGVPGMNGGDTLITRANPTHTGVAPLGLHRHGVLQTFAPNQNENVYTHLWTGPFYGYERVIETFGMTDQPRRLKPVDIYYHAYSASKPASLRALQKVYDWALARESLPVFTSEYIRKVHDFHDIVIAREDDIWQVDGADALRTLRIPTTFGYPASAGGAGEDAMAGTGIAGFRDHGDARYLHLDGATRARFTFKSTPQTGPRLVSANARLVGSERVRGQTLFRFAGHVPADVVIQARQCSVVRGTGVTVPPARQDHSPGQHRIRSHADTALEIACR